jgi:hypothetical protein
MHRMNYFDAYNIPHIHGFLNVFTGSLAIGNHSVARSPWTGVPL